MSKNTKSSKCKNFEKCQKYAVMTMDDSAIDCASCRIRDIESRR